ncbi:MAG: VOC family protein [Anaerolineae bacterium]|nr:MAG: VOC family protein [Anaerolineae bacterium]
MKHTFAHFEIPADDVKRAIKFYTNLFGWQISAAEGFEDYWFIETGKAGQDLAGGLMARQAPDQGPVYYVQVESVADYAAKVEELGGKVIVPQSPVPGMGWFAHFQDTEGNVFALWESDESAG